MTEQLTYIIWKILEIVNETLWNIAKNGFDKDEINSAINSWKMNEKLKNLSYEKVDLYLDKALSAWLYDEDMIKNFQVNAIKDNIKEKSKNGYFEKLVRTYFLNSNHSSIVVLKPKIESVSDAEEIPTEIREIKGSKVLNHPIHTNGVQYVNVYFDISKVSEDKLMYLMLLTKLLGVMDTKNYSCMNLNSVKDEYIGDITLDALAFENSKDSKGYYPKLKVSISSLDDNLEKSFEILNEIINKSKLANKNPFMILFVSLIIILIQNVMKL